MFVFVCVFVCVSFCVCVFVCLNYCFFKMIQINRGSLTSELCCVRICNSVCVCVHVCVLVCVCVETIRRRQGRDSHRETLAAVQLSLFQQILATSFLKVAYSHWWSEMSEKSVICS